MPIFEYLCNACGNEFSELILRSTEEKDLHCPACGSVDWKRLISPVRFHLTEAERVERFDPRARQSEGFYRDTRNIGLSALKRAKKMGIELGNGFSEKLERARSNPSKFVDERG